MNRNLNIAFACAVTAALIGTAAAAGAPNAGPTRPSTLRRAQGRPEHSRGATTARGVPSKVEGRGSRAWDPNAALGWPRLSAQAKPAQTAKPTMSQAGGTVTNLGSVRIPRAVKADGQALPAGTYQIRVTETPASPPAPGQTPQYERWAEFLQGGQVRGREVVTVIPSSDISQVADMKPPASGSQRVEVLKGGDYMRLWLNRGGTHYLIHFNI